MDKDSERMAKYKNLSEILQNLYGSPASGATMYQIFTTFQLPEEKYQIYAEAVGDIILGFYKISDLPRLLQQKLSLSADQSQRITSQLIEFLAPVVRREEEEAKAKKEGMAQLSTTFAQPNPERLEHPNVQELTGNVAAIRTMEGDMNRVHGYGAYVAQQSEPETIVSAQDDVLAKKQTPSSL